MKTPFHLPTFLASIVAAAVAGTIAASVVISSRPTGVTAGVPGAPAVSEADCLEKQTRVCPDRDPRCLAQSAAFLPEACRRALAPALRRTFIPECADDVEKLCPDASPFDGGIVRCLLHFKPKLSAACDKRMTVPPLPPPDSPPSRPR